jgi:hypothetical protein
LRVGHRRPRLLDQRGAGDFDGDARQDGTSGVPHDAGNGTLREDGGREEEEEGDANEDPSD